MKEMPLEQPNFHAEFYGGPLDGLTPWLATPYPEFRPVQTVHGEDGKVLRKQVALYRLESSEPVLVYRFVSLEDL